MDTSEELREALLNLEDAKEREKQHKEIAETLLAGLRVLAFTENPHDLFQGLLDVIGRALDFEAAFILKMNGQGMLIPESISDDRFAKTVWKPQAMFQRVLDGESVAVFDVGLVDEWRSQPKDVRDSVRSALHFSIGTPKQKAMFIFTHSDHGHFSRNHLTLARRFSMLASQAFQKLETERRFSDLKSKLEAEAKLAELNRKLVESEKKLASAKKMEALGLLAGGVAHEFNNVLAIIMGNAELALDDVPDWNPAKESLKEIRTASFRAKDVVGQILSFARKTMTAMKPMEINTTVRESLKLMRASIPTMIDIQQNISSEPHIILGDPTEIHQIVINLCTNAAHAMKETGGVLEVGISKVPLDEKTASRYEGFSTGDFVKLTVRDTGQGIPPDVLEKVFEPYFTTKEFGAGSGMGLAVVHGLVKKCKGDINIESAVGEGTTVEVLFPKTEEAPTLTKKEDQLPTGNERILLVDDDPSIVTMIRQMLERLGYNVKGMTDSPATFEQFKSAPNDFDLVITDMAMPNMSGDNLAAELIKVRSDIPILLCTGHSDTVDEKKAKQIGIKGFAMKPLDMGKLAKAVRAALDDG